MEIQENTSGRIIVGLSAFAILVLLCCSNSGIEAQTTGAGGALQALLDDIQVQINDLSRYTVQSVNRLNASIEAVNMRTAAAKAAADAAGVKADAAQSAIDTEITPAIETLTAANKKLTAINQTWKKNFKIVNETIQILRKKIALKAPRIPLS